MGTYSVIQVLRTVLFLSYILWNLYYTNATRINIIEKMTAYMDTV